MTFRKCLVLCMSLRVYPYLTFEGYSPCFSVNAFCTSSVFRDPHGSPRPAAAVGKMLHEEQQRHPGLEDNYSPGTAGGRLRAGAG